MKTVLSVTQRSKKCCGPCAMKVHRNHTGGTAPRREAVLQLEPKGVAWPNERGWASDLSGFHPQRRQKKCLERSVTANGLGKEYKVLQ